MEGTGGATTITTDNGTLQMIADVTPANASNKSVTWTVTETDGSATDKATISSTGLLTAVKNGTVKVKATSVGTPAVSGTLEITISNQVDTVINIAAIVGVTAPVRDAAPVTTITETDQYTGTVSWSPEVVGNKYAASTAYTATITLTAKDGYTLTGVAANFFTVADADTVSNDANSGVVTAVFPATAAADATVDALALDTLVVAPVKDATPDTTAIDAAQYTGTIAWFAADGTTPHAGAFAASTVYVAKATLTAKAGYTLTGVTENSFTYTGATSVANAADAGVVTITFPATAAADPTVVNALALDALVVAPVKDATPDTTAIDAAQYTGTIAWFAADGTTPHAGAFAASTVYVAKATLTAKAGYTLTGVTENSFTYTGATSVANAADAGVVTITFPATAAADPTVVNALALDALVVAPVKDATPDTTAIDAAQYTGTIAWFAADGTTPHAGAFAASTVYVAKATLTAKAGYTLTGVTENSFTYTGATSVANAADAGVVTITFPATAAADPTVVNALALDALVVAPVKDATPDTTAIDAAQYTGTIAWFAADGTTPHAGAFAASTVYVAKATLTAKAGYTLTGVTENSFTYTGATSVANAADAGVVTITFPATAAADTTPPVITASDKILPIANLAAWTGTVSANDDVDGDVTANVVATYFKSDGSTSLTDLAAAKEYIGDASVNTSFIIKYNVSDAAGNAATEVVVTITVTKANVPDSISVGGKTLNSTTPYLVDGTPATTGTLGDGNCTAHFDPITGVLSLQDYVGGVIRINKTGKDLNIKLIGNANKITEITDGQFGIYNDNGDIYITSDNEASLEIDITSSYSGAAIVTGWQGFGTGSVIISGKAKVKALGITTNGYMNGIQAIKDVTIQNEASFDANLKVTNDRARGIDANNIIINTTGNIEIDISNSLKGTGIYGNSGIKIQQVNSMLITIPSTGENATTKFTNTTVDVSSGVAVNKSTTKASYRSGTPYTLELEGGNITLATGEVIGSPHQYLVYDEITIQSTISESNFDRWTKADGTELETALFTDSTTANSATATIKMPAESLSIKAKVADTTAPVITASDATVAIADLATWTETVSATDDVDGDVTSSVVATYFESDGTTSLADLAAAKSYIDDATVNTSFVIKYNVSDAAGNAATEKVVTITVTPAPDTTAPVITASDATVAIADLATWTETVSATDDVDGDVTSSVVATYFESDGTTSLADLAAAKSYIDDATVNTSFVIKYNVSDAAGNAATEKVVTITVTPAPDTTAPVITASDATVAIADLATWTETVSATDDVDGDVTSSVVATYFESDGTTSLADLAAAKSYIDDATVNTSFVIKYNVSDAAGNAATEKVVTITVTPAPDTTAPVITASDATVAIADLATWTETVSATDDVDGDVTSSVVATYFESDGTTSLADLAAAKSYIDDATVNTSFVIKYNVSDAAGNAATEKVVTITVTPAPDTTAPVITASDATVAIADLATWTETVSATDDVDGDVTSSVVATYFESDGTTSLADLAAAKSYIDDATVNTSFVIKYNVSDAAGNAATEKVVTITVTPAPDTTAPVITASDATVAIADLATWTETVSATDDVDGDVTSSVVATYFESDGTTSLADLAAAKSYIDDATVNTSFVIKYNVSDAAGNAATEKVVTITVTPAPDTTAPVITASDATVAIADLATWTETVSATDDVDGDVTSSVVATYFESDGTTSLADLAAAKSYIDDATVNTSFVIKYNVSDAAGNAATEKVVTITVTPAPDTTAPVITASDATVAIADLATWTETVSATDDVDGDVTSSVVATYFESDGTTSLADLAAAKSYIDDATVNTSFVIKYNVSDAAGNAATEKVVTITVTPAPDTTAPVITASDATVAIADLATWTETVSATDDVDGDVTSSVVATYFESDGTTSLADLAAAKSYIDDATVNTSFVIKYNVSDAAGNAATEKVVTITVTPAPDTTAPVITASDATVAIADLATWTETVSATDDVDGDVTSSVVATYFESDGTTSLADLAAAKSYIDDATVNTSFVIKYNVSDAAGNAATEKVVTITVTP